MDQYESIKKLLSNLVELVIFLVKIRK